MENLELATLNLSYGECLSSMLTSFRFLCNVSLHLEHEDSEMQECRVQSTLAAFNVRS